MISNFLKKLAAELKFWTTCILKLKAASYSQVMVNINQHSAISRETCIFKGM
jgi:hypothetical protein